MHIRSPSLLNVHSSFPAAIEAPTPLRSTVDALTQQIASAGDAQSRLQLMLELADITCHFDARSTARLLSECHVLAMEVDDPFLKGRYHYADGGQHIRLMNYTPALTSLHHALSEINEVEDEGFEGEILGRLGNVLTRRGEYPRAMEILQKGLALVNLAGDPRRIAVLHLLMGRVEYLLGRYHASYEQIMHARALADQITDPMFQAQLQGSFGSIHLLLGQSDRAMEHAISSREAFASMGYLFEEADLLTQIAVLHGQNQRYDEARASYDGAFDLLNRSGYEYLIPLYGAGYGEILAAMGNLEEALRITRTALGTIASSDSKRQYGHALRSLASMLIHSGDVQEAREAVETALEIFIDTHDRRGELSSLRFLANVCEEQGDMEAALQYFKRYDSVRDGLQEGVTLMRVEQERVREALGRAEREKNQLQRETDRLRFEMETKGRELTAIAVELARRNEDLQDLRATLDADGENAGELAAALRRFLERRRGDEGWGAFERSFDSVHGGFIRDLVALCPTLTPTEIRICTLLRLNLSTKEIASILSLSPHTVETHRRSIRRRLGLAAEENLVSYLAGARREG